MKGLSSSALNANIGYPMRPMHCDVTQAKWQQQLSGSKTD
jgi:hypothetical protein